MFVTRTISKGLYAPIKAKQIKKNNNNNKIVYDSSPSNHFIDLKIDLLILANQASSHIKSLKWHVDCCVAHLLHIFLAFASPKFFVLSRIHRENRHRKRNNINAFSFSMITWFICIQTYLYSQQFWFTLRSAGLAFDSIFYIFVFVSCRWFIHGLCKLKKKRKK